MILYKNCTTLGKSKKGSIEEYTLIENSKWINKKKGVFPNTPFSSFKFYFNIEIVYQPTYELQRCMRFISFFDAKN